MNNKLSFYKKMKTRINNKFFKHNNNLILERRERTSKINNKYQPQNPNM